MRFQVLISKIFVISSTFLVILIICLHKFVSFRTFEVSRVIDGDTIKLKDGRVIRYIGIDTPEAGECYFDQAKKINESLVLSKKVMLKFDKNNLDEYGRYLAYVYFEPPKTQKQIFVNQYLLENGAGVFFKDYLNLKNESILIQSASLSHDQKKGLWSFCAQDPAQGCIIKGNIDRLDKRWYHLPEFRHYNQVVMRLDKGDRWFCTESQAIKAGFSKARD